MAKTLAQALGIKDGRLELNSPESLVCPRCGTEPRLYHQITKTGLEVVCWIPLDNCCARTRAGGVK